MFLIDASTVVYSASDLTAAANCEWALMRRLDDKLGRDAGYVDEPDEDMLMRTAALGDAHELRKLQSLRETTDVVEFADSRSTDPVALQAAAEATEAALKSGAPVLYQATFFDGRFVGYADFIELNEQGRYEVFDTKLARRAKITALLQVAAYSDQLLRLGIPIGENVHLLLGDGSTTSHRVRDILPVYQRQRARLQRLIDDRLADASPTFWRDDRYAACGRCAQCQERVNATRDVLMVAGMRLVQRTKLAEAGVLSIDDLASLTSPVAGMTATTLESLREQAALQVAADELANASGARRRASPPFDVRNPDALQALPEPDAGDIFFDFEGDPLYSENNGPEWGLDYLFGLVEADASFRAFWAHNHAEERQALIDFLAYVDERRAKFPGMHIYHYASYERTHLLSLAARHGVGEEQVDDLLRANVLVDLFPVVKKSMRVGTHSYSIKKLEPLYMPATREGVDNAADSIIEYADAMLLRAAGDTDAADRKLVAIADYNRDDCVSTLRLRDWLIERAREAGVRPATKDDLELDIPVREPDPVYLALAASIEQVAPADRDADQSALALASAAIDYHRREGKKFWQEHYDRLRDPVEQWCDTRDVLVVSNVVVQRDWHKEGRQRLCRRILHVSGELAPGSSIKPGHKPFLLYDEPFPPITPSKEPGARPANGSAVVCDVVEHDDVTVYVVEECLEADAPEHDQLPMALAPGMPPNPRPQPEAIAEWGGRVLDHLPAMLPEPALDLLRRQPPRGALAPVAGGDFVTAICDSLLGLDRSYIAVQGPPGTGKTYTGSRAIARLVLEHGWRIGVVAQSHEVVENMLKAILKAGLDACHVGKRPKQGTSKDVPWTTLDDKTLPGFTNRSAGWVLGGTAWDFSNAKRVPRQSLDLLVVDEAGQFSVASTIASAVAAKRLLLLGDPQQLPQVSQGTHPEPVDESALGWLSDGHDVLPAEFGYFLARSWRMHPAVCAPVSRLSYEGKLESVAAERRLAGVTPGLHVAPVDHHGNSTSSPEEAEQVVQTITSLLGRQWEHDGTSAPLDESDVIVVAPYNAQVDLIRQRLHAAGLHQVPVGTVDKFQGKEAAVAIVSLSASSAQEVPRGLEFLLLPNRLNVAISRAQWAAYLVYSPTLTDYLPRNQITLAHLSAFIELVDGAAA